VPAPAAEENGNSNNPGTIEELHKKCQNLFPVNFEGAKLLVSKGLNSHFQVSHTLTLAATQPSGYRFGATYVGTKMLSPTEVILHFPVSLSKKICPINDKFR
jgi:mitochondrial import receptor subunit TOM40